MSSMDNTIPINQASELEITEKHCENPGPSKPSEQLKYIRWFLKQVIPTPKEKIKQHLCIKLLEKKEAQKQKCLEEK